MMYVKMHESDDGDILAMCDESLIDKTLSEGEMFIDVKGYSDFYTGDLVDATNYELPKLDDVISFNIIGDESVGFCVRNSIVDADSVKTIEGVPFAHAYKVDRPE